MEKKDCENKTSGSDSQELNQDFDSRLQLSTQNIEDMCAVVAQGSRRSFLKSLFGVASLVAFSPFDKILAQAVPFGFWKQAGPPPVPNLFTWGTGTSGQLGDGTIVTKSSPVQVGDSSWSKLYAGSDHTLAIRTNGSLWAWGFNSSGALGDGTNSGRSSPVQVGTLTTWTAISCGLNFSAGLRTNSLWMWGENTVGQLGQNNITSRSSPVQVAGTTWKQVACGLSHTLALKTDNTIWSWGNNVAGQLGHGNVINRSSPVQIGSLTDWKSIHCSSSSNTSFAIKNNGTLWAWGDNSVGQLGFSYDLPTQLGADNTWTDFSIGTHILLIRNNNTLWASGGNGSHELGVGSSISSTRSPIQVGSDSNWLRAYAFQSYSFGVKTDGTLWAWGRNMEGQLGLGTSGNFISLPTQVGSLTNWKFLSAGGNTVHAVKTDGTLWAWGVNSSFQFGNETSTSTSSPVQIGGLTDWSVVASGPAGFCLALKTDKTLWAWGVNSNGQLGNGNTTATSSPTQVGLSTDWSDIACAQATSFALKDNGTLWSWGNAAGGILGSGGLVQRSSPVQVGLLNDWSKLSASTSHVVALKTDNNLWSWGWNTHGGLGDGTRTNRSSPVQVSGTDWTKVAVSTNASLGLKSDGTVWVWGLVGSYMFHASPVQVGTGTSWDNIACGSRHVLGKQSDGTLWSWGDGSLGRLGDGTINSKSLPTQIGTMTNWANIACGSDYSLATKTDGTLWAWGANSSGRLGDGTITMRSSPVQIGSATDWLAVTAGTSHSAAIKTPT